MNVIAILRNRQYHLTGGVNRNSCPTFKRKYIPSSLFHSLNVDKYYNFIDSNESYDSPITAITHHDTEEILLANDVGDIVMLNKSTLNEIKKFHGHNCAIFDVKWRPKYRNHILTGAGDRSIILWDLNRTDQSLTSFFPAHHGSVKTLSFESPNIFISGGRDGAIKIWDLRITCALKHGPMLTIPDPHIHILPSIKSTNFRTVKSRRQNPIAWSSENINYHPSNVVTCVDFHPNNSYYFYSSGIADNSIKVWDIRRCHRQYQCTVAPTPTKIHTTKNISLTSNNQGYSSFFIQNNSSEGPILFASSTNGNIYAFTSNSIYPTMVFSGRYSNAQTKISYFGDYLLSGSTNSCIYLWNCDFKRPLINEYEDMISIENRLPIFEMNFNNQQELPLVVGDFKSQSIYCSSEPYILWKWSFKNQNKKELKEMPFLPSCKPYIAPEKYDNRVNISLKRASSFEAITCKGRSNSLIKPLTSITNWIHSETKRFKMNENSVKDTPINDNDENTNGQMSKSTSYKMLKNRANKRRNLKRNLFNNNRKISEFFTTA